MRTGESNRPICTIPTLILRSFVLKELYFPLRQKGSLIMQILMKIPYIVSMAYVKKFNVV
jgi:hypothetical protein